VVKGTTEAVAKALEALECVLQVMRVTHNQGFGLTPNLRC